MTIIHINKYAYGSVATVKVFAELSILQYGAPFTVQQYTTHSNLQVSSLWTYIMIHEYAIDCSNIVLLSNNSSKYRSDGGKVFECSKNGTFW